MARPPMTRQRQRGDQNGLVVQDGFAARPPVRQQEPGAIQDNSMGAHMNAILSSDLRDARMTDDQAFIEANTPRLSDAFGQVLSAYRRIHDTEIVGHDAALRDHRERGQAHGGNLPAMVNRGRNAIGAYDPMAQAGRRKDWLQIRRMEPYLYTQIRALGAAIFPNYTQTQIEDINTLGTLTHDRAQVAEMMRWVTDNGTQLQTDQLDFGQNVRGYHAETSLWEVDRFTFLLVNDNHGMYIYGWPAADTLRLPPVAPNVPRLR